MYDSHGISTASVNLPKADDSLSCTSWSHNDNTDGSRNSNSNSSGDSDGDSDCDSNGHMYKSVYI